MLQKLLRPTLVKRFFECVRDEGWGAALRKTRTYGGIVLRNAGRSALNFGHRGPVNSDHKYYNKIWRTLAQENAFHVTSASKALRKGRQIAIVADMNLPQCTKYRVEQLAEFWRSRGVEVNYSHYLDVPRSINIMQNATHLVLYRIQNMPTCSMYMYEARRLGLPVLYDIDDPLFSVSAYETYENMTALDPKLKDHFLSEAPKYLDVMNGSDVISVSTPGMVDHAKLYTRRPVYMRRNFADQATLSAGAATLAATPEKGSNDGAFRVAFASGSQGHEVDFAQIEQQVIGFLEGSRDRRLTILGHFDLTRLPEGLRDRVDAHKFTDYAGYLETLATVDCAVMPLTDDIFNRCKSAVRVIDASSVAVPSIVGPVGDMAQMVRHGETGFIAETPQDWTDALTQLANDKAAANRMGQLARQDLETRWSGSGAAHIIDPELLAWVEE
ncbi:glycosyltransferase [uncultured Litoreibacter sp.]|uniref:glycosyltransferase n=1 Tax=uncultured Litoreibacter sp. TaxID=1392394 RepID=UPI002621AD61|nr:glycosyltransferase [uncultured Litoreibacter sp.]